MRNFFKLIYSLIPFKRELFLFLKKYWNPAHNVYQHLHFKGVFKVKISEQKSFKIIHYGYEVENEIFWAGLTHGWEKESMKLWIKLCANSNSILDIGANTGLYALIAKTLNPKSKVYAFEPVNRVFEKLEKNIQINCYDIIPIKKAISNYNGKAFIYDLNSEHTYSVTVNKNLLSPSTEFVKREIETIRLDDFITENEISNIDLIKIDVETHEPEVLEGFGNYLQKFKPTLLIEILNNEVGNKVETLLNGMDYLFFNIDEKGGIRKMEKITKSDYFNYLICSKDVAKQLHLIF